MSITMAAWALPPASRQGCAMLRCRVHSPGGRVSNWDHFIERRVLEQGMHSIAEHCMLKSACSHAKQVSGNTWDEATTQAVRDAVAGAIIRPSVDELLVAARLSDRPRVQDGAVGSAHEFVAFIAESSDATGLAKLRVSGPTAWESDLQLVCDRVVNRDQIEFDRDAAGMVRQILESVRPVMSHRCGSDISFWREFPTLGEIREAVGLQPA